MFVVKKPAAANKTIRLPLELIDRLNEIAADKGVSFNYLVHECINYALADMQEDGEDKPQGRKKKL